MWVNREVNKDKGNCSLYDIGFEVDNFWWTVYTFLQFWSTIVVILTTLYVSYARLSYYSYKYFVLPFLDLFCSLLYQLNTVKRNRTSQYCILLSRCCLLIFFTRKRDYWIQNNSLNFSSLSTFLVSKFFADFPFLFFHFFSSF